MCFCLAVLMLAVPADKGDEARRHFDLGRQLEEKGEHARAVVEFDKCLAADPDFALAHDHRGSEQFKLGRVAESLADFDRYLKREPRAAPGHWKRGISLYYVGRYADGRKQFEGYQTTDANDVENAVWHFLCNARAAGVEKARGEMLKIGRDVRVPMMEVYALYKGEKKPADVLAAAEAGDVPAAVRQAQRFYAHLYLGLYYDATGDRARALEHMTLAAGKYRIGHYMGDVARVHEELLRKQK